MRPRNVSSELLKGFFNKKKQFKKEGFKANAHRIGAKKSFLSDAHVKNIISEMQEKTDKSVDRLRLQQYYKLTSDNFVSHPNNFPHSEQTIDGATIQQQTEPNQYISPSIINNRLNRLKRLEDMNA